MTVDLTRAGGVERRRVSVPVGTPLRTVLHSLGQAPEGSAVLLDDVPVPLDTPIERPARFTVLPTFSGG